MNNASAPEASEQPEDGQRTQQEANQVPASLSEFLATEKASARNFGQLLSKRPPLSDGDLAQAYHVIDAEPKKMDRVVELVRAVAGATPQPVTLLRWCEQVVRSRDAALRDWALDPSQNPEGAFQELLAWAYPRMLAKDDQAKSQLAESCLLIGLNLLMARRGLSPLAALHQLALASRRYGEQRGNASPERIAVKQMMRAGIKQLSDFARVAALSNQELSAAEDARRAALTTAGELRRQKESLEAERVGLVEKVQVLSQKLGQREDRITELTADLEGARIRSLQELDKLKARFRREIGERLAGLLSDAWDAIDSDPPHPTVARERLEIARDAIRREVEWLNRSLD